MPEISRCPNCYPFELRKKWRRALNHGFPVDMRREIAEATPTVTADTRVVEVGRARCVELFYTCDGCGEQLGSYGLIGSDRGQRSLFGDKFYPIEKEDVKVLRENR